MRMMLSLCFLCGGMFGESPLARLDPDVITEVRVEDAPWKETESFASIVCQDKEPIESLVAVLKKATPASDHRCAPRWRLTLTSEADVVLDMLPGHDDAKYEFRFNNRLYGVSRPEFIQAMQRIGLQEPPLEPR